MSSAVDVSIAKMEGVVCDMRFLKCREHLCRAKVARFFDVARVFEKEVWMNRRGLLAASPKRRKRRRKRMEKQSTGIEGEEAETPTSPVELTPTSPAELTPTSPLPVPPKMIAGEVDEQLSPTSPAEWSPKWSPVSEHVEAQRKAETMEDLLKGFVLAADDIDNHSDHAKRVVATQLSSMIQTLVDAGYRHPWMVRPGHHSAAIGNDGKKVGPSSDLSEVERAWLKYERWQWNEGGRTTPRGPAPPPEGWKGGGRPGFFRGQAFASGKLGGQRRYRNRGGKNQAYFAWKAKQGKVTPTYGSNHALFGKAGNLRGCKKGKGSK